MSLRNSYAVWNNKGGVGKSTIAFHLATSFAQQHPRVNVLVVDLCPQSNCSMMLLGGGTKGEDRVLEYCQHEPIPRTVVGYIASVLSAGPKATLPDWRDFVVQVNEANECVADNLFLLSGDGNLEPMAPLISERATQAPLTPDTSPWEWVHLIIRNFIADVTKDEEPWLVLVDTNPSFSTYTEIAISAVDKLIVPVNADDASRVATNAMFTLIFGAQPPHPIYGRYTFASRAAEHNLARPIVHLIVGNRLTQYGGPAAAFGAMSDATANALFAAYQSNPDRFSPTDKAIKTISTFRDEYSIPLRDFNTAGVVAAHQGKPLSSLKDGTHSVHGAPVAVHSERLAECRKAVEQVASRI
jgi:cellulose biosynthesis protein BcsQ